MKKAKGSLWRYGLVCLLLVALLVAVGCEKDDTEDGVDTTGAPDLPPSSTMVMDFSDFTSGSSSSFYQGADLGMQLAAYTSPEAEFVPVGGVINWGHAVLQVAFWSGVLTVNLAIPTGAFCESFNHDPEEQEDGSWIWAYNVTVLGSKYNAALHGAYVDNETHWDMYITKEGAYTDFHWYSGVSNFALTEGTWTLKKNPYDPVDYIGIEWHRSVENDTADITYTNLLTGTDDSGGYITYGKTADEDYDAYYDIYNMRLDNLVEIEWNRTTKAGRIKNPNFYEDDQWHTWEGLDTGTDTST